MRLLALTLCSSALAFGCAHKGDAPAGHDHSAHDHAGHMATVTQAARAELSPTQGNETQGSVTFTPSTGGVLVKAEVTGLTPGPHGFHVHEKGDCSAPDASSAGGHFNPTGHAHGGPTDEVRHVGDLGNLVADESGRATLEWLDPHLSLEGEQGIVGRAVIVHAAEDDLHSQPTGNAGGRVACGIITN